MERELKLLQNLHSLGYYYECNLHSHHNDLVDPTEYCSAMVGPTFA